MQTEFLLWRFIYSLFLMRCVLTFAASCWLWTASVRGRVSKSDAWNFVGVFVMCSVFDLELGLSPFYFFFSCPLSAPLSPRLITPPQKPLLLSSSGCFTFYPSIQIEAVIVPLFILFSHLLKVFVPCFVFSHNCASLRSTFRLLICLCSMLLFPFFFSVPLFPSTCSCSTILSIFFSIPLFVLNRQHLLFLL